MLAVSLISLIAIVACFCLIMGVSNLIFGRKRATRKRVARRIANLQSQLPQEEQISIERQRQLSSVPWLNTLLSRQSWSSYWDGVIEQADVSTPLSVLVLSGLTGAAIVLWLMLMSTSSIPLIVLPTLFCGSIPFLWLYRKRAKRIRAFQKQLPDALDLIARSLKAGHAFTQGMRMVSNEFPAPLGEEFSKTLDEINFGIAQDTALYNLTQRVNCTDLKFFVVSVSIQRETGGNLAELVGNIGKLVRDRFVFEGRVKVLAAEGKLTAYILLGLPIAVGFVMNFLNTEYMSALYDTEDGLKLLWTAASLMVFGALALKKMITIKV